MNRPQKLKHYTKIIDYINDIRAKVILIRKQLFSYFKIVTDNIN